MRAWPPRKQRPNHAKRAPEVGGALSECVWECIDTVADFDACTESSPEFVCLCQSTIAQDAVLLCVGYSCDLKDMDALNNSLDRCPSQTSSDTPGDYSTHSRSRPWGGPSPVNQSQTQSPFSPASSISTTWTNASLTTTTRPFVPSVIASTALSPISQSSSADLTSSQKCIITISPTRGAGTHSSPLPSNTSSTSPSVSATTPAGSDPHHHPRTAMVVVSSLLGSLLFIGLVTALILCIRRYRRHRVRTPSRLDPFLLLPSASTSFDGDRQSSVGHYGGLNSSLGHHQRESKSRRPSTSQSQRTDDDSAKNGAPPASSQGHRSLSFSALFSPSHVLHICAPPAPPQLGTLASMPSPSSLSSLSRRAQNGAPSESVLSHQGMEMHVAPVHHHPPGLGMAPSSLSGLSDLSRRAQRGANSESGMSMAEVLADRQDGNDDVQIPCEAFMPRDGGETVRRGLQETRRRRSRTIEVPAVAY